MDNFTTYDQFKDAVSSEKIVLCHIYPRKSINTWTSVGSNVWTKEVTQIINRLFTGSTEITKQTSSSVDASNPFFYDITANKCYYYTTSTSPDDDNLIAEHKLYFSNAPINLSWDLTDDLGEEVCYEPRVLQTVGFKSQIGADQKGISITGSGTVKLQNNDGYFDSLFNGYTWENKKVEIYSYNRSLDPSSAQIQYKGFITNKAFNLDNISFKIDDSIFKMDTKVPMNLFTAADGVGESFVGQVKRRIYGSIDGLLCRSVDQVGDGVTLSGTVSNSATNKTITGLYTQYTTELATTDKISISGEIYTVDSVTNDTEFIVTENINKSFDEQSLTFYKIVTRTGTISGTISNKIITGVGTLFTDEMSEGDKFTVSGTDYTIKFIESDTIMYVESDISATFSTQNYTVETTLSDFTKMNGTVSGTSGASTLTGTNTSFTTDLETWSKIKIGSEEYQITSIASDISLTIIGTFKESFSGKTYELNTKITGFSSADSDKDKLIGVSTSFLTELAQGDSLTIDSNEYTILEIESNTRLTISESNGFETNFSGVNYTGTFSISNPEFNRSFFVADHVISQKTTTITAMTQLNRIIVNDIDGFEVNDTVKINGDAFTVFNISGDQIQLHKNADELYAIGTSITKEPITKIFLNGTQIDINDLSSVTNVTDCKFTLNNEAEFRIAKDELINEAEFTFTNGSRIVYYTGSIGATASLQPRDWIKVETEADTTYMRIVDIVGNKIRCSTTWSGNTGSGVRINKRRPDYITDDFNVSIFARGKTKDGTASGVLIETGADIVLDLLTDIGLASDLDLTSFADAALDSAHRMSISLPYSITDQTPKLKDIINDINQSIFGALALKQDMTLGYYVNSPERVDTLNTISDDDIIKWKMKGTETKSYERVLGNYNFIDFDNTTKQENSSLIDFTSSHITDYDISNKEIEADFRVYNENSAQELTERRIHFSEQSLMEMTVESDLRLEHIEIGSQVRVDFDRFIQNDITGDNQTVFTVTGISKTHNKITLILSDIGNLYNRSAVISNNSVVDYSTSTAEEKRFNSYITDDNGIITGNEETKGTNLIV